MSRSGIRVCSKLTAFKLLDASLRHRKTRQCLLWVKSGHRQLFDHLVGARKQRGRHREAERLCGLEVDHEIKSGWLFYWQVSGFAAL